LQILSTNSFPEFPITQKIKSSHNLEAHKGFPVNNKNSTKYSLQNKRRTLENSLFASQGENLK